MRNYTVAAIFPTAPESLADVVAKLNISIDKNGIYGVGHKHDYIKKLSRKMAPEFNRLCGSKNIGKRGGGSDGGYKFSHWEAFDLVSVSYLLENFHNLGEKYPLALFTPAKEWIESPELSYFGNGYHKTRQELEIDWDKYIKGILQKYATDSIALLISCAAE